VASRKIEVILAGDAGDLERSLVGALAGLKAFGDGAQKSGKNTDVFRASTSDAERGLYDFDKAASKVNKTMSGGPLGLFDAIGNVGYGLLKLGGFAQKGEAALGDLATSASDGEGAMAGLGSALSGLAPVAGVLTTGIAALGAALLVLPALAGVATFALTALLDVVTILSAVVVAALGPLAVFGGLLAALGGGFFLAGQRALKGGGIFKDFGDTVEKVTGQFHDLVYTLGGRFLPLFEQLAGAASTALHYLNQIAKLPLKQAFQSLSTTGVAMLNKFVYAVANVLKKPFKLAVDIAFGSGGANAQQAIGNWWTSLTNYLFGYTKTRPIHIGSAIVFEQKNIQGALQPIVDWFDRQNFTATGLRWAHDIIDGAINAWNHDKGLRQAVRAIMDDAGRMGANAFKAAFAAEIHNIPWKSLGLYILHQLDTSHQLIALFNAAWNAIKGKASSVLHAIPGMASSAASAAGNAIKNAVGDALNWIRTKAAAVWNAIKGFFSNALSLHINWPSPPSWLNKVLPSFDVGGIVPGPLGSPQVILAHGGETVIATHKGPGRSAPSQGGDIYLNADIYIGSEKIGRIVNQQLNKAARDVNAGKVWG
jgi:hypothetical protein